MRNEQSYTREEIQNTEWEPESRLDQQGETMVGEGRCRKVRESEMNHESRNGRMHVIHQPRGKRSTGSSALVAG
jgi:hypothetical protein